MEQTQGNGKVVAPEVCEVDRQQAIGWQQRIRTSSMVADRQDT
jgi:hypothetical protein